MNSVTSLKVHSFLYHPTISNIDNLQQSNRGIFPASLYSLVEREEEKEEGYQVSSSPIIFRIYSDSMIKSVYVTAHEFSAMEGVMYLSSNVMNDTFIIDGQTVEVCLVSLPIITKLVLRPLCSRFAREIEDAKSILEQAIIDRYQVLSIGDIIVIDTYELEVTNIEPSETVITNEADPEVDFLPCWEDVEKERMRKEALEKEKKDREQLINQEKKEKEEKERERRLEETYQKTGYRFIPFEGSGQSLNGNIPTNTNTTNSTNATSTTSINAISTNATSVNATSANARNLRNYNIFYGKGNKLGN